VFLASSPAPNTLSLASFAFSFNLSVKSLIVLYGTIYY
jgi:hypothetical protein